MISDALSAARELWTRASSLRAPGAEFPIDTIALAVVLAFAGLLIARRLLTLVANGRCMGLRPDNHPQRHRSTAGGRPPADGGSVATSWNPGEGTPLGTALAQAQRLAGPDAMRILIVSGEGMRDLCHSMGLMPPGEGTVRIAVGHRTVLIDAARADVATLKRLASALPRHRPIDAIAAIVDADGIPAGTLSRATGFARATGFRVALHFVISTARRMAVWRVVEAHDRDGHALCFDLAQDTARHWLTGGSRQGLSDVSNAGSRGLPEALDAALAARTLRFVDIASLCLTGAGLRAAAAQTAPRTRPAGAPVIAAWSGVAALLAGASLAGMAAVTGSDRASALRAAVESAAGVPAASGRATSPLTVASTRALQRTSELAVRVAGYSAFSPLMPLAFLVPGYGAPGRLGGLLLDTHVVHKLAIELDRRARAHLAAGDNSTAWIENARIVGTWLAAWQGLAGDPQAVDLRGLLVEGLGGEPGNWPEGMGRTLARAGLEAPAGYDRLDPGALTALTHEEFVKAMQRRAHAVYTNGPVAHAARRAGLSNAGWRERHDALRELRTALRDPGQSWLVDAGYRSGDDFDLRVLGNALTLPLLGEAGVAEARHAVDRIRADAREAAERFVMPEIGPLLLRGETGAPDAESGLDLSPRAGVWLTFLDRLRSAGVMDRPQARAWPSEGPVTPDPVSVAATRAKLRTFDRFAAELPAALPPEIARDLLVALAREFAEGVAAEIEFSLRPVDRPAQPADRFVRLTVPKSALDDLTAVETWLREFHAPAAAHRVLVAHGRVAGTLLESAALALEDEDPMRIQLDAPPGGMAPIRQFERGVERMQGIYRRAVAPYIQVAERGGEASTVEWLQVREEISRYRRGETGAALSGVERTLRAYADDPASACGARQMPEAADSETYVERAVSRIGIELDRMCSAREFARMQDTYDALADYFNRHVSRAWPYSTESDAQEISSATLSRFVRRLHAARGALESVEGPLVEAFLSNVRFWTPLADGGASVRFRVEWRARRGEELEAHHVAQIDLLGAERDASGVYTWRYGEAAALRLRLAANSPYRFVRASDPAGLVYTLDGHGSGALLRIFEGMHDGALTIDTEVADRHGARIPLRVTARVTYIDGVPMSLRRNGDDRPDSQESNMHVARG